MYTYRLILQLVVVVLLSGCKTTQTTQKIAQGGYHEDLSIHRLNFGRTSAATREKSNESGANSYSQEKVMVDNHIKMELDSISDMISMENAKPRTEQGFTIQLYNGDDRAKAQKVLGRIRSKFPEIKAQMEYYQPDFKVKVGKFTDRITAYETYEQVRRDFPEAFLIPEKININYD